MTGVYLISSPTNKVYVGQSWNLEERYKDYKICDVKGQHKIYNSIKKYGWKAHKFEVIFELSENTTQAWLDYWETFFWNYYKSEGYEMLNIREPGSRGKMDEETKRKIGISNKTSRKLSGHEHYLYGKKFSEEFKKKLSDAHKGRNTGKNNGMSRSVMQFTKQGEFIKEWDCGREASIQTKVSASKICVCCQGKRKTSGGFIWKYKE